MTFLSTGLAAQKVPQRTLDISSPSVKQIFKQAQKIPRKKITFALDFGLASDMGWPRIAPETAAMKSNVAKSDGD